MSEGRSQLRLERELGQDGGESLARKECLDLGNQRLGARDWAARAGQENAEKPRDRAQEIEAGQRLGKWKEVRIGDMMQVVQKDGH